MKVISVVNHKGGVGKTTVSFNFAAELARRGKRVLLIDFDMQGNLSSAFGIKEQERKGFTIADLIEREVACQMGSELRIFQEKFDGGRYTIDIIPCNIDMGDTLLRLNARMAREFCLQMVLNSVEEEILKYGKAYDYVIIDCAPSILVDFQNALVASNELLIVANPDIFSTSGMSSLLREYKNVVRCLNPNLKVAGVLINNVDARTNFTKAMVNQIQDSWKNLRVFKTVIPASIRVKESVLAHLPMCVYEPENPVSKAYSDFTDEYLGEDDMR